MSNQLIPLTSIGIPSLVNFVKEDMNEELITQIQNHPDWDEIWDGQLLENSSFAIINFFTYIATKLKEGVNRGIKENFFVSANDPQSIINGLLSYGLSTKQNTSSVVEVTGEVQNDFIFEDLIIAQGTKLSGRDLDGNSGSFEIYNVNNDDSINYRTPVIIESTNAKKTRFTVKAFSGVTQKKVITLPSYNYERFTISDFESEVIDDNIEIWFDIDGVSPTKLIRTDSFKIPKSYDSNFTISNSTGIPMYKVQFDDTGSMFLIFGTQTFGGYFPSSISANKNLTIFYRTGGGRLTNISKGAINQTLTFAASSRNLNIAFTNFSNASGGGDRLDLAEEQFYAPYKFGKDKSIVGDIDAFYELSNVAIHHELDSPKYSETDKKVNILHYNNYIVPFRGFSNFVFPTVEPTDTVDTYNEKFIIALNKYLNVDKIHDGSLEEEVASEFVTPVGGIAEKEYYLELKKPMNASVTAFATAPNNLEKIVDKISFTANYSGSTLQPDLPINKARIKSPNIIRTLNITTPTYLRIAFDEIASTIGGDIGGQFVDVIIDVANYGLDTQDKATLFAETINNALAGEIYLRNFNHEFCYIDDEGYLILESAIVGELSKVRVVQVENQQNLFDILGIEYGSVTPEGYSQRVFKQDTNYDHDQSKIDFKLNASLIDKTNIFEEILPSAWPDTSSVKGPIAEMILLDENDNVIALLEGQTIVVTLEQDSIPRATVTFNNISSNSINVGVPANLTAIDFVDENINAVHTLDFANSKLLVQMAENNGTGLIPLTASSLIGNKNLTINLPRITNLFVGQKVESAIFGIKNIKAIVGLNIEYDNFNDTLQNLTQNLPINSEVDFTTKLYVYGQTGNTSLQINPLFAKLPVSLINNKANITSSNLAGGTKILSFDSVLRKLTVSNPAIETLYNKEAVVNFNSYVKRFDTGETTFKVGRNINSYFNDYEILMSASWIPFTKTVSNNFRATGYPSTNEHNKLFEARRKHTLLNNITDSSNSIVVSQTSEKYEIGQKVKITMNANVDSAYDNSTSYVDTIVVDTEILNVIPSGSNTQLILASNMAIALAQNDTELPNPIPNDPPIFIPTADIVMLTPADVDVFIHTDIIGDFATTTGGAEIRPYPAKYLFPGMKVLNSNIFGATDVFIVSVDELNQTITTSAPSINAFNTPQALIFEAGMTGDFIAGANIIDTNQTKYVQSSYSKPVTNTPPDTIVEFINLTSDIIVLNDVLLTTMNYTLLEFTTRYRVNGKKGTNILEYNPLKYLKPGMTIDNPDVPIAATINTIDSMTIGMDVEALNTNTNEEFLFSSYYSYETFSPEIYDNSVKFTVQFQAKNYGFIFVSYKTNPYINEGEAYGIISKLRADGKRMIGIEPLLKKVNFKPIGVKGRIKASPGVSRFQLATQSIDLIRERYGYTSKLATMGINKGFPTERIKSLLNNETINLGVDLAYLDFPIDNIPTDGSYDYYFVLSEDFINRMKVLEEENSNILGISSLYDIIITGVL